MRIVVTGANGLLGADLVPRLARAHDVAPMTRADGDVTDVARVREEFARLHPEWVVHLAAFTNVDAAEVEVEAAYRVNALGARIVADAARRVNARVVYLSTDYVFDGESDRPYTEWDATNPLSAYGASKLAGEAEVLDGGPGNIVVRTSWLFGRGGKNFVDTVLARAAGGESLAVVTDQRGAPTYAPHLSDALARIIDLGLPGVYHATNAGLCTWYELACEVMRAAGFDTQRIERTTTAALGRPAPRPANSTLANVALHALLDYELPSWEDAVREYVSEHPRAAPGSGAGQHARR